MKPPLFEYYQPKTLSEALGLLSDLGETAKPLAGGQSLVPMMNMRLARPAQLVDLNRIRELDYVNIEDGELRIGAMTRQRALERSPIVREHWPLLSEATRYIGHVHIRNRGTVGGSLAHAYPPHGRHKVRYVGEPVALVVAENRYLAEGALELIDVRRTGESKLRCEEVF